MLNGKKVIALGERDGVSGPAIAACAEAAGAEVVFTATECFVWTASGAMDLQSQAAIARLADTHGTKNLVVLLGAPDPESAEIAAETVVLGDPAYAGALAETQLGLAVYHILEDELRATLPADIYDEQVGVMADVLDPADLTAAVAAIRARTPPSWPPWNGTLSAPSEERLERLELDLLRCGDSVEKAGASPAEGADDIPECYSGYAAWARKRCDAGQCPPGFPEGFRLKHCVQGWLAHGK